MFQPELLESVTLVDMTPVPSIKGRRERVQEVLDYVNIMRDSLATPELINNPGLPLIKSRKIVDKFIATVITEKFIRDFLLLNLVKDGKLRWKFNLDACEATLFNLYELINVNEGDSFDKPTLMIYGGRSDFFNEAEKAEISKLYPRTVFHKFPDAGHYLHIEKQEEFLIVVNRFLNQELN